MRTPLEMESFGREFPEHLLRIVWLLMLVDTFLELFQTITQKASTRWKILLQMQRRAFVVLFWAQPLVISRHEPMKLAKKPTVVHGMGDDRG